MDRALRSAVFGLSALEQCEGLVWLRELGALRDAAELELLKTLADGDAAGLFGATDMAAVLHNVALVTPGKAAHRVSFARQIVEPEVAATREALRTGEIDFAQAEVVVGMVRALRKADVTPETVADAQTRLLTYAADFDAADLRTMAREVLVCLLPDSEDDKERRAREQRGLSIRDRGDGSSQISGRVTDADAALINACLDPLAAPQPQPDGSRDPRSADVRRLDAMLEALSYGMRHGYTGIDDTDDTDGDTSDDDLGDGDGDGDDDDGDGDGLGFDLDTLFAGHPDPANDSAGGDDGRDSGSGGDGGSGGVSGDGGSDVDDGLDGGPDTGGGPDGGGGSDGGSGMDGLDSVAASGGNPPAPAGPTTSSPATPATPTTPTTPATATPATATAAPAAATVTGGGGRGGAARGAGGRKTGPRSSTAGRFRGGPTLLVVCDLDALTGHDNRHGNGHDGRLITGPQTISHIPLTWASFERRVCDGAVRRLVLSPAGVPLDVGRKSRTVTPAIRAAVIYRDRICTFPGCDRSHTWCDAHHCTFWTRNGPTCLSNIVLACSFHHDLAHQGWDVRVGSHGRAEWRAPYRLDPHGTWHINKRRKPRNLFDPPLTR
jgi:Domain of unknown function (DUF222)